MLFQGTWRTFHSSRVWQQWACSTSKGMGTFCVRVYNLKGATTLPSLRWELFPSKNLEGEMPHPTCATFYLISNYITTRDKLYQISFPDRPPIEANGWNAENGLYITVRCLAFPAPQPVIELIKCSCKAGCKARCSCSKNNLPQCKCYSRDCTNTIIIREDIRDSESESMIVILQCRCCKNNRQYFT